MAGRVAGAHGPHRCGGDVVDAHGWNISKRTHCSLTREHWGLRGSGWCWGGGVVAHCWVVDQHVSVGWFPAASRSTDVVGVGVVLVGCCLSTT